jgi:hypothetical protein
VSGVAAVCGVLAVGAVPAGAAATSARPAAAEPASSAKTAAPAAPAAQSHAQIAPADRARELPKGWQHSSDRAVTTDGDPTGLHVLVADARDGYTWRTAATLSEPGADTDQWIGQSCLTASGRRAVVVYAPRQFSNDEAAFREGGFVAVVDLDTGAVRKLALRASLAYYNPGCGAGEKAVITSNSYTSNHTYLSRLVTVDAATGEVSPAVQAVGQVTSAVPAKQGLVGAKGADLVSVDLKGGVHRLSAPGGTPFRLSVDRAGAVGYEVMTHGKTVVRRNAAGHDAAVATVADGSVQLHQVAGQVYLQGTKAYTAHLPAGWDKARVAPDAQLSTGAGIAVTSAINKTATSSPVQPGQTLPVSIKATVLGTGAHPAFTVTPSALRPADGTRPSPAMASGAPAKAARTVAGAKPADSAGTVTTDPNRGCAIARNDPGIQSLQPTPQMDEWAADLAVKGALTVKRAAGWNGSSLPAYTPQGLFPSHPLVGGGQVPAQVLLGVMAQESNEWQAGQDTVDGESGNFETGGFYGKDVGVDSVNFATVDCGYGATQVTTGMKVSEGGSVYTPTQQLALTVDYAANIAAGLEILQDKWNQVKQAGVVANNADPSDIENWWFALWAYNTGWHDPSGTNPYGLGWTNNMADEDYPPDRIGYLDASYDDAKTPNHWSYPERVLGWTAHPLLRLNWVTGDYSTAYERSATPSTTGVQDRPPLATFCASSDDCDITQSHKPGGYPTDPGSPCLRDDLECWWHQPVTWTSCPQSCSSEIVQYQPGAAEPSAASETLYRPDCSNPLPAGTLVVDDVPASVHTNRTCAKSWTDHGTLSWQFGADSSGNYPSKIDFHQLDGGFGGHMWTAHTWATDATDKQNSQHAVTGTWTLDQAVNGWARVMVYVPDHGAMDPQARYTIHGSDSTSPSRSLVEGNYLDDSRKPAAGSWVSLGAFHFAGTPSVSLDNLAHLSLNGGWVDDDRDVDWDAVAFQPLPGKPADQIVALGDSYASGEGASNDPVNGAWDWYRSSDHDGTDSHGDSPELRDACHRSPYAWSREAGLPDNPLPIGTRADRFDPTLDYHMSACSGARGANLLPGQAGQYQEGSQLDQGYLDQNTTLVTLSIGGNDARFTDVISKCLLNIPGVNCSGDTLDGDDAPLNQVEPELIQSVVAPEIEDLMHTIALEAPNAKILLMGYPELLSGTGDCIPGIFANEATWLNQLADLLDTTTAQVASDARAHGDDVTYADPRAAFAGKAICSGSASVIHPVEVNLSRGDDPQIPVWPAMSLGIPADESFHPTVNGALTYATVASNTLSSMF